MRAKPMHRAVTDANAPDLSFGKALQEPLRSRERIFSHFKRAVVDIDGNDLAAVACFHLWTDLLLVKLLAAPRMFLFAVMRLPEWHGLYPRCKHAAGQIIVANEAQNEAV